MRYASVLKPAAALTGAAIASSAGAVTVINTDYAASSEGTPIAIGVDEADAQYSFYYDSNGKATLEGQGPAYVGELYDVSALSTTDVTDNSIKTYDPAGRINYNSDYVALKFDIDGVTQLGYAKLKNSGQTVDRIIYDLASVGGPQSPVPEPATWAMMIAGLGAVGFAERRRRRAQTVSA